MNNIVTSRRWQEFFETLSQTLDINIGVVDATGKLQISFLNSNIGEQDYFVMLSNYYKKYFYKIIKNFDSNSKIVSDPFGLLIAIVPIADNYLVLGGVRDIDRKYDLKEVKKILKEDRDIKIVDVIYNNQELMSREELKSKTKSAQKLYNQLLYMSKERKELGQKMMLLTALEEFDKLLLSLIEPESFNISPLLDLICSTLIILFDAEASWVFSHCNNQYFTAYRGNHKNLLEKMSEKWAVIINDKVKPVNIRETWSGVENKLFSGFTLETTIIENEEFQATIGFVNPRNNNVKEALIIFSRLIKITLEMQSFLNIINYRLGYLLKYLRQGIIIYNIQGKIITFNHTANNFFSSQGIELVPGTFNYKYFMDKTINRAINSVIKNEIEHLEKESIIESEGEQYHFKWDAVPLKDKNDKIKGAILVFEDITEINRLKHQIQEQERKAIAGNLAAGFAHEIRNPLSVAGGAIQLLEIVDDPIRQSDLIHKLRGELERINEILTDFLDIAKPNKRRELIPIKLPKVIEEIEFLIKSDTNLNNIKLTIDKNVDTFPLIKGDSTHLKQVFLNIMKNAIEAMEDGGELKINYSHSPKNVSIIFEDNGPGIPEEHLPLILRSFFTTKVEGTGLGLSVSSELVKSMGGELKIESKLGEGTIIKIEFPLFKPRKNPIDL